MNEKIANQPTAVLKKPNVAVVMMPRVGKLSALSRKIFNVLLKASQETILEMNRSSKPILATHRFKMSLRDLLSPLEAGGGHLSSHVRDYFPSTSQKTPYEFNELLDAKVDWWAPDRDGDIVWTGLNLFSEIKYNPVKKELLWALPPSLFEALEDVEDVDETGRPKLLFTLLDLEMMALLKTYTAIALFEIATRYKNNPSGVTSEQTVEWWMSALLQSAPSIDPKTKQPKARSWAKFKDEQLKPAIEEINAKTDLFVSVKDRKTGKKITHAQFSVKRKRSDITVFKDPYQLDEATVLQLTQLGLRVSEVKSLMQLGYSQDLIRSGLVQLGSRLTKTDLEPVGSKIAYLRSLIQKMLPISTTSISPGSISPNSQSEVAQQLLPPLKNLEEKNQVLLVLDAAEQQRLDIREEIKLLAKEEQIALAAKALSEMPSATPNMRRRATEGDWENLPLVAAKMIDLYATYGTAN